MIFAGLVVRVRVGVVAVVLHGSDGHGAISATS